MAQRGMAPGERDARPDSELEATQEEADALYEKGRALQLAWENFMRSTPRNRRERFQDLIDAGKAVTAELDAIEEAHEEDDEKVVDLRG